MNLLPWLLDWPPRPATVVAVLLVTALGVGTLVLFAPLADPAGPDEAALELSEASVHLNDEIEIPDGGDGTVAGCRSSGTPGDHLLVRADVVVETPPDWGGDAGYDVAVRLPDTAQTTTEPVDDTGRERVEVVWLAPDDETLSVGDTAELLVRLRESGTPVANATRTVTVEAASRSFDCGS